MNYVIKYALIKDGNVTKKETVRIKNKSSEYMAKGFLVTTVRKKEVFDDIKYLHCREELPDYPSDSYPETDEEVERLKNIFGMN